MKNKSFKVIMFEMIVIVLAIVGITLAISYYMNSIDVDTSNANVALDYSGTTTLPTVNLMPVADSDVSTNTNNVLRVNFSVKGTNANPNKDIIYDVILDELDIPCSLKQEYVKWQLYKNNTLLTSGNFSPTFDIIKDNKLYLTTIQQDLPKYNETADSYELVIWISETCTENDITSCTESQDQSGVLGETISGKVQILLHGNNKRTLTRIIGTALTCDKTYDDSGANSPALVDGLIPVKYDEENNTWVKADATNKKTSWYNYSDKRWANAVLVGDNTNSNYSTSNTIRATYTSAAVGTPILESDILAYYVWIPRYKYRVFNIIKTIGTDSYNAQTTGIDIIFEGGEVSSGTIKCNYDFTITDGSLSEICTGSNGDYYTHPAFTFGNDEVTGFWVGKFEISSETPDVLTGSSYYGGGNVTNLTVRIKPNVRSWRYNTVTNFYKVIYDMQIENNIYGLNTSRTNTDSHMLKNMEWGAIAYLTNSKYGRCINNTCTEVTVNNSDDYITGNASDEITTSSGNNDYNTLRGQLASTTGNIYGVYDMSGGASEYVMGNMSSASGSYTYYASNGGSNYIHSGNEKYIDMYARYSIKNDQTSYNRSRLGDATGETKGWYSDSAEFVANTDPWFYRGGYSAGTTSGTFTMRGMNGNISTSISSRAVLLLISN